MDDDVINQDLDHLSLNDEVIRNQINLNLNNNNYNEQSISRLINEEDEENEEEEIEEDKLTDLIVTSLPIDLFTNEHLKKDFETLFKKYDENEEVSFVYFRILKRCTVKYLNESSALNARYELDNQLFLGEPIRLFFSQPIKIKNSRKFLVPPENQRTFLISPPASPPVGWESQLEDPPVVNLNLVAALSSLAPHEPYELIESRENIPGIVLHPCADDFIEANDCNKPRKFIPTRRPASDMS